MPSMPPDWSISLWMDAGSADLIAASKDGDYLSFFTCSATALACS